MDLFTTLACCGCAFFFVKNMKAKVQLEELVLSSRFIIREKDIEIKNLIIKSHSQSRGLVLDKKVKDLIRLANGASTTEEARTAAVEACKRLKDKI